MFHLRPVFTEVGSELSRAPGNGVLLDALEELLSRDQLTRERERVRVIIVFLLGIFEVLEGIFEVAVVDELSPSDSSLRPGGPSDSSPD